MPGDAEHLRRETFMRLTLQMAEKSLKAGQLPIGALITSGETVVAKAFCSDSRRRMLEHAELLALTMADMKVPRINERRQMTLYTNLEPCVMCLGAAMSFCVGQIVFGIGAPSDGAASRLSSISFGSADDPEYRLPDIVGGVMMMESRALFQTFIARSTDRAMVSFAKGVVKGAIDGPGL